MIRFFLKRGFEKTWNCGLLMKSFSRKIRPDKGSIQTQDEPLGYDDENKLVGKYN